MISLNSIQHIEKVLSNEISSNLKEEYNTWEFKQLLQIQGMVKVLRQQMEKNQHKKYIEKSYGIE